MADGTTERQMPPLSSRGRVCDLRPCLCKLTAAAAFPTAFGRLPCTIRQAPTFMPAESRLVVCLSLVCCMPSVSPCVTPTCVLHAFCIACSHTRPTCMLVEAK